MRPVISVLLLSLVSLTSAVAVLAQGQAPIYSRPNSIEQRTTRQPLGFIFNKGTGAAKTVRKDIDVDGVNRYFLIYTPTSVKLPAPLVLAFHGGGGTAEGTDRSTGGLSRLADSEGFIVAYPSGIDRHWSDGRPDLTKTEYDDVKFVATVIDNLVKQGIVDDRRVYATGISNGGFFSQYLAIKLPGRFAAVASVAATVPTQWLSMKVSPVPILMLLGTNDTLVPFEGGKVGGNMLRRKRGEVIPARDALAFWLKKNGNNASAFVADLPDADPEDESRVRFERFGNDGDRNEVVFYEIKGGGHTWPGGMQYLPKSIVGPVCRDIDGNRVIWNFFREHQL